MLSLCLIKHANSNKTTVVHASVSANRLNNNNNNNGDDDDGGGGKLESNHTPEPKMMLTKWQLTHHSTRLLEIEVDQSQRNCVKPRKFT
jgi:hypothetical protein